MLLAEPRPGRQPAFTVQAYCLLALVTVLLYGMGVRQKLLYRFVGKLLGVKACKAAQCTEN